MVRSLLIGVAFVCASVGSIGCASVGTHPVHSENVGPTSDREHLVPKVSSQSVPRSGATVVFPTIGDYLLDGAPYGLSFVLPAIGVDTVASLSTADSTRSLASGMPLKHSTFEIWGACWDITQVETVAFSASFHLASIPSMKSLWLADVPQPGTEPTSSYRLFDDDGPGTEIIAESTSPLSPSPAAVNAATFPSVPKVWEIRAHHTYVFEVLWPGTNLYGGPGYHGPCHSGT